MLGFLPLPALHGQIGGGEGGDIVLARVAGGHIVAGPVGELQVQGLPAAAEHHRFLRGDDVRRRRLREIGQEDVLPQGRAVGSRHDLLDIQNVVLQVLVEDPGLYLQGRLRGLAGLLIAQQRGGGAWGHVERIGQTAQPAHGRQQADDAQEFNHADAAGAHGRDLAIGSEPAQAQQDTDEHGHRQGQGQGVCQQPRQQPQQVKRRGHPAHKQLQQGQQITHQ